MKNLSKVLAIETSCDDTSVAVVREDGWVEALSSVSQDSSHSLFGGIVPEIAHRNHSFYLLPLLKNCMEKSSCDWKSLLGLSVTSRPGLLGSLLVGLVTVKTLALAYDLPFLAINHLEAHLFAPFLKDASYAPEKEPSFPYLALVVSGGHTFLCLVERLGIYKILGSTRDDAAGEAFDKFAQMLGLGFPGGRQVDMWAKGGNSHFFSFPRPLLSSKHLDFSFSGLKTSAYRFLSSWNEEEKKKERKHLCAGFQEAILDVLMSKLDLALKRTPVESVVITGGVSANSALRKKATLWAEKKEVDLFMPPLRYCTDNAAMVGYIGIKRLLRGEKSSQDISPSASSHSFDFISVREK